MYIIITTLCIHCVCTIYMLMRDEKEGRKKQARSNKQQGKATQHTQGSHFSKEKCATSGGIRRVSWVQIPPGVAHFSLESDCFGEVGKRESLVILRCNSRRKVKQTHSTRVSISPAFIQHAGKNPQWVMLNIYLPIY